MWTKFKFFFGRAEFVVKAAPGVGIISSMVLLSDDLDEIDWEFLGGVNTSVQTNYFGKGYTGTYNRSTSPAVASPQTQFHTYALDWSTAALTWSIDGVVVRTLNAVDADGNGDQYPQSPMKVSLGLWDAGDPDAPTKEWAGGVTPIPPPEPYTMYVKSVKVFNQNPAQQYQYTDRSGSWQSIKVINDVPFSSSSSLASTQGTTLSLGFTSAVSLSQTSQTSAGMSSLSSNSTALASAASMQLSSSSLSSSSHSTVAASKSITVLSTSTAILISCSSKSDCPTHSTQGSSVATTAASSVSEPESTAHVNQTVTQGTHTSTSTLPSFAGDGSTTVLAPISSSASIAHTSKTMTLSSSPAFSTGKVVPWSSSASSYSIGSAHNKLTTIGSLTFTEHVPAGSTGTVTTVSTTSCTDESSRLGSTASTAGSSELTPWPMTSSSSTSVSIAPSGTTPRESWASGSGQTPVSTISIPLTPILQSQIASSSSSAPTASPLDFKSIISLGTLTAWGFSTSPDITTTSIGTAIISSIATASRPQLTLPAAPAFDTEEDDDWEEDYEPEGVLSIHPAASSHTSDDPLASEENPSVNEKASSLISPVGNDDSPPSTTDEDVIDLNEDDDSDSERQASLLSDVTDPSDWEEDTADDEAEASNDDDEAEIRNDDNEDEASNANDVYDDEEEWDTPPSPSPSQRWGSLPQPPYARPNGTGFQGKPSIAYATPSGVAGATTTTMPFKGGAGGRNGMRLGAWCVSGLGVVLGIMVVGL
ncbi:MAG: hypothetical protein Q9171_002495 [Xanthocarpia ochracea]